MSGVIWVLLGGSSPRIRASAACSPTGPRSCLVSQIARLYRVFGLPGARASAARQSCSAACRSPRWSDVGGPEPRSRDATQRGRAFSGAGEEQEPPPPQQQQTRRRGG